ncbi:MEDS domain-containing protein [Dactylosporangium sp. NPDC051484]|uniref:MEDS domain-containing protein n=1 Tax=Dactylosporangium sp. NPDC051484 TaxID=3154942 RepID=UPI00344BD0AD
MPEAGAGRELGTESVGRHVTLAYSTDEEIRDLLTGFVRRGVAAGQRVMILLDSDAADLGRVVAAAAAGAAPGQFAVLRFSAGQAAGAGPSVFGGPGFGVPETLAMLSALRDETFAAGYPAVAIAGQMLWALRAGFTPADLMTYETRLNRFFGDPRVTGLCLYDRRRFAKDLLDRIGAVHPGPLLGFTLGGWGAHLRLTGQVDASNGDSLPSILELVAGVDSVVMLDASDLSFVDVAGARTIVRFAASRPHRHTVVRCPRGVRQALWLVGAEAVPSLVLRDRVARV